MLFVPEMRDPKDRHVVAAALIGRADVIVTFNLKDFEDECLPGDLFSQSPDDFLLDLIGLRPGIVLDALDTIASRTERKGPKWTVNDLLKRLQHEELHGFVDAVKEERRSR